MAMAVAVRMYSTCVALPTMSTKSSLDRTYRRHAPPLHSLQLNDKLVTCLAPPPLSPTPAIHDVLMRPLKTSRLHASCTDKVELDS
ncbi:hypothetical protein VTN96DRAFT_7729 [Rasamsonia emersonii]